MRARSDASRFCILCASEGVGGVVDVENAIHRDVGILLCGREVRMIE